MTIDFEYYRKINGLSGATSKKDYYNKQIIKSIDTAYKNTLSTFEILINSVRAENIIADNIERKCIFDYSKETTDKNTKTDLASYSKEMWIEANVINVGSIIEHVDKISLAKNIYLVVSKQEDTRGFDKCFIQKTNNTIKFYDKNHVLYEIPCIVSNSVSIGNEETKYITTVDNQFYLTVPNTPITQQIKVNNVFKIGTYSYQIESVPDDISQKGLLIFKMKYNPEAQEEHIYQLAILNGDNLQIAQSQSLTLNVQLTDNGEIISNPSLLYSSNDETIATIDQSGVVSVLGVGTVTFTVFMSSDLMVNDSIVVEIVADEVNNFTYEIQGADSIYKGYSQNYKALKYLNGVLVEGEFTFSIESDSVPESVYSLEVIDNDECKITANQSVYYVTLKAEDVSNGEIVSKEIKLRNLF